DLATGAAEDLGVGVVLLSLRGSARALVAADARGVVERRAEAILERLDLPEREARVSELGRGAVSVGEAVEPGRRLGDRVDMRAGGAVVGLGGDREAGILRRGIR